MPSSIALSVASSCSRNYCPGATVHAMSIDELLERARQQIDRVDPAGAAAELGEGALLIDIRSDSQRARDGTVPDAVYFPRNVLEWRCDPESDARDPRVGGTDRR